MSDKAQGQSDAAKGLPPQMGMTQAYKDAYELEFWCKQQLERLISEGNKRAIRLG